jgi:hypothetical protein
MMAIRGIFRCQVLLKIRGRFTIGRSFCGRSLWVFALFGF